MSGGEEYIKQAGIIADEGITSHLCEDYLTISFPGQVVEQIERLIEKAIDASQDNAEYLYFLACAKIARGEGKTGLDEILRISKQYPEYIDARGFATHPQQWFSPFYYPSWHENQKKLPEEMKHLPSGGMSLVSLRDGCRRIVSFFRHVDKPADIAKLKQNTPIDITFHFMETPYGTVIGAYVLVDYGSGNVHVSETILNADSCPLSLRDLSSTGFWLLRLLSQQRYTYIIFNDPKKGIILNKKLYLKSSQIKRLEALKGKIELISPKTDWDPDKFKRAQEYYMNNFSLDELFVNE